MATVKIQGFENYERILQNLQEESESIIKSGIYEGAKVIADAVRTQIVGIRTEGPSEYETKRREIQKKGLQESLGISSMRNDRGFINVKIGFDGYNDLKSKRWPQGQPNAMIARIFESGTSFSSKQPFFKKALNQSKRMASEKMKMTIDERIHAIERGRR